MTPEIVAYLDKHGNVRPGDCPVRADLEPLVRLSDVLELQRMAQRAIDAWDTTTHQKNGDGRLWQCMEELRGECAQ